MKSLTIGLALVLLSIIALVVAGRLQARRYAVNGTGSVVATYPVADLVRAPGDQAADAEPSADMRPLVDIITSTVAPGTWQVEGKPRASTAIGTITPFYPNNSLIVRHTSAVQVQVQERLRQLRRLPPLKSKGE